jgi:hypothetical protein
MHLFATMTPERMLEVGKAAVVGEAERTARRRAA